MTAIQLSSVPEAARADAFRWKTILEPILMADRRRVQLIHDTARTLEISEATVRAKFYAFKRDGLKGLIDKRAFVLIHQSTNRAGTVVFI